MSKALNYDELMTIADYVSCVACSFPGLSPEWEELYWKLVSIHVRVEMPCGEMQNSKIAGYIWAWDLQKHIRTARIEETDQFSAQGLEGKFVVEPVDFLTAVDLVRHVPKHRIALYLISGEKGAYTNILNEAKRHSKSRALEPA